MLLYISLYIQKKLNVTMVASENFLMNRSADKIFFKLFRSYEIVDAPPYVLISCVKTV